MRSCESRQNTKSLYCQQGMSLVGVLIGIAVMGILAAALATMYQTMSGESVRKRLQSESDNLEAFLRGVLSQKDYCQYALKRGVTGPVSGTGNEITWNHPNNPLPTMHRENIDVVQVYSGTGQAVVAASSLPALNKVRGSDYLRIGRIFLQPPGGVPQASTPIVIGTTNYRIYQAELVVQFTQPTIGTPAVVAPVFGGILKPIVIPLVVYRQNTVAGQIDFCDSIEIPLTPVVCTAATVAPGQGCGGAMPAGCQRIYLVYRLTATGTPLCKCQELCMPPPPTPIIWVPTPVGGPGSGPGGN